MSQGTGIEWTDCTWTPVAGCAPVSAGCANCNVCRADSYRCRDPNGGDESEWPADLRVREFPEPRREAASVAGGES